MTYLRSGTTKKDLVTRQIIYYMKKYSKNNKNNIKCINHSKFKKILDILVLYRDLFINNKEFILVISTKIKEAENNDKGINYSKYENLFI